MARKSDQKTKRKGRLKELEIGEIISAEKRIRRFLPITPLTHSPAVSEIIGHDVFFKWDNKLKTGSFKERGAVNFLCSLTDAEKKKGVCAASAGNHALALSYHAAKLNIPCHIVMPVNAPLIKVQATKSTGAHITLHGQNFDESLEYVKEMANRTRLLLVHAFEDLEVVAGQGTCGSELLGQLPDVDSVIVPVGGGGLISGVATFLKERNSKIFIMGVQSEWVAKALHAGQKDKPIPIPRATIADGIAVKRFGQITGEIISDKVDKLIYLNETDIARSMIQFLELERTVVEGAGAVALGAILGRHLPKKYKKTVALVTGSNVDPNLLSRLIERDMGERGRLLRINVSVPDRPGSLSTTTGLIAETRANVLHVLHDRSSSLIPGNVDIAFLLEVKDREHKMEVIRHLRQSGIPVMER